MLKGDKVLLSELIEILSEELLTRGDGKITSVSEYTDGKSFDIGIDEDFNDYDKDDRIIKISKYL